MSLRQSSNYVWSVADVIGHGATGCVYIARSKKDGKPYAAKVFMMSVQMRSSQIRMRETALLRKLQHENVVTLVAEEAEVGSKATVLIMELCDSSLYHILELPENYYGLSEDEFKCVLQDVASGMKYLREHNVVHRDVKPGNILRKRSSTGGSIYKLTDFGAARQLNNADQSFMSIYGTEEYLHPDVYEKAVMKNFSNKKFTAAVDLWSMGVTFYHAATGQLPFRPYGGRQNKDTMFEIISRKGPKIISGIQRSNGGRIEYDDDLPEETRISKGLKVLLRPVLQELLETSGEGLEDLISFEQFHKKVEDIASRQVVDVFALGSSTFHKIYMKKDEQFEDLKKSIATHTDVKEEEQLLFLANDEFNPSQNTPLHGFPKISRENPLIVIGGRSTPHAQLYQRKITNLPKIPTGKARSDNDIDILKIYASMCFVYQFSAEELYHTAVAIQLAFDTTSSIINTRLKQTKELHKSLDRRKMLIDQVVFRANKELFDMKTAQHPTVNGVQSDSYLPDNQFGEDVVECLRRGSQRGKVVVEEREVVGEERQQISDCINTVKERVESLSIVRRDLHLKFDNWFLSVKNRLQDLGKIGYTLAAAESNDFEKIACHVIDQISAEKMRLFVERNRNPDSGLVQIEAEVSSLERILRDVVVLVEEGDQKLMSSKEIFEELSTCGS
eukprot:gene2443-18096_t